MPVMKSANDFSKETALQLSQHIEKYISVLDMTNAGNTDNNCFG
jgi:hypothetical protein